MERDKQQDKQPLVDRHGYRIIQMQITPDHIRRVLDRLVKFAEKYEQSNKQQQSNEQ